MLKKGNGSKSKFMIKQKHRKFKESDQVYAEDFSASNEKWIPGVVQKVTGPLSYHIQLHDGRVI